MGTFIANMIIKQADISTEKGREKYKAYFSNTTLYAKWQTEVDVILNTEGYTACIVTE